MSREFDFKAFNGINVRHMPTCDCITLTEWTATGDMQKWDLPTNIVQALRSYFVEEREIKWSTLNVARVVTWGADDMIAHRASDGAWIFNGSEITFAELKDEIGEDPMTIWIEDENAQV